MLMDRILEPLIGLPRFAKKAIVLALDSGLCVLTVWLAYYLRTNLWVWLSDQGWQAALVSLIALPIFATFGLYRTVFRYVSWEAFAGITQACLIYGIIYAAIFTAFGVGGVPRTIGIIQPLLLFVLVASSRAFGRYWLGGRYRDWLKRKDRTRVFIYGAGSAGRPRAGAQSDSPGMRVVGLIDDNRSLHGHVVAGVQVLGPDHLAEAVEQLNVSEILLAIPSCSRRRRNEILNLVRSLGVSVRTLPGLVDIAQGRVTVNDLRPLEVDDLLARDAVVPDQSLLEQNIRGKTVLVTGAGGSIGGELCRQIVGMEPLRLILVESSEYALYAIHRELARMAGEAEGARVELVPLLASVCDEVRMGRIIAAWQPQTVYHAAAYKHVPLVEQNVCEGVRNNVTGTWVCGRLAQEHHVENFVLISTDKAVRPTNVMGASKRLAEMVLQAIAAETPATCFSMVRFGNVLGSSGSVVPLFRQQIAAGGPVTVTHREITRYFMTIPEAAQLVLQAGAMAKGGEVFVLDMSEPVRIVDLATRMIELAGLKVRDEAHPDGDIDITFTGLRPGEKLYEELLIGDNPTATTHPRVMMANEPYLALELLVPKIRSLSEAMNRHDVEMVLAMLEVLVPEYVRAPQLVDSVHKKSKDAGRKTERSAPAEIAGLRR
jgi:FlaA1/EpsC-like NDP-sugar epimerase